MIFVSGVEATATSGIASCIFGCAFYTTHTGTTGAVSQEVHHLFEFQTQSNPVLTTVKLSTVTYSNLTKNFITFKIRYTAINNL